MKFYAFYMNTIKTIKANLKIQDTEFVGVHSFDCGHNVPIYDVKTYHALNQILGHVKYNNRQYGKVYYRGECNLHNSLIPSLMRKGKNPHTLSAVLSSMVNGVLADKHMYSSLGLSSNNAKHIVEGVLQHYGIPTRNIDLVDNHWVALWMGLYKCSSYKSILKYYHYSKREVPMIHMVENKLIDSADLYQYVLLVALPFAIPKENDGVSHSKDFIEIDLRQALPSFFIRPHAQHGIVAKRKVEQCRMCSDYDMADQVCAIFRMRIDRVAKWIGTGDMLTQENLFPSPAYDGGYDRLLAREDLFKKHSYEIARYF